MTDWQTSKQASELANDLESPDFVTGGCFSKHDVVIMVLLTSGIG
jgi:hypothetical protein